MAFGDLWNPLRELEMLVGMSLLHYMFSPAQITTWRQSNS